jgi:hypothetical protein
MPETKAWPEGPIRATLAAIVEMKHRNPKFGCVRIAQQIAYAFGIEINKDVVRGVIAIHSRPKTDTDGPSWLTVIAQAKDSVWSLDLFALNRWSCAAIGCCWSWTSSPVVSPALACPACIDGMSACRMFNAATTGQCKPKYLSTDHDPLFRFHRWLLARQPARDGGRGDQVGSIRSGLAPIC